MAAISSNRYEKSVVQAMQVIADQRIANLKLDKTIVGVIDHVVSGSKYAITYNGGLIYAFAQNDDVYYPRAKVYILVPQGDFNQEKRILGLTSNTQINDNLNTVVSIIDGYSKIGNNLITMASKSDQYAVNSLIPRGNNQFQDCKILYQALDENVTVPSDGFPLQFNREAFHTYLPDSKGFLFSATFKTELPAPQVYAGVGNYGLILTARVKSSEKEIYNSTQEWWDAVEPRTQFVVNSSTGETVQRLKDFKDNINNIINDLDENKTWNDQKTVVEFKLGLLNAFIVTNELNLDSEALQLCNLYAEHIQQLLDYDSVSITEIKQLNNDWFTEPINKIGYQDLVYRYDLDTNYMTGNVYNLREWTYQYIIQDIDPSIFQDITGIYFFCNDFAETNSKEANSYGNDIFVDDISFFCLREATDGIEGDYRLELEFPDGQIFKTNSASETLRANAKITYKKTQDKSSVCSTIWFKENQSITSTSAKYNSWAGPGWEKILEVQNNVAANSHIFTANKNMAYENKYLCLATYNLETILRKTFTLYNEANKKEVQIESNSGTSFMGSQAPKILTCLLDGKDKNFENNTQDSHFRFNWSKIKNGKVFYFDKTEKELEELINDSNTPVNEKPLLRQQLSETKNIKWNQNILEYPASQIANGESVLINCTAEKKSDNDDSWYTVGQAEIELNQSNTKFLQGYYIEIINGDQVFQYSESGIAPTSERYEQPVQLQNLSCVFHNPSGMIIDPDQYTVRWQVPTTDTMLLIDSELIEQNPETQTLDTYYRETCPVIIKEEYDFSAVNNQIRCLVDYAGSTYSQSTTFYFGKVGENGTNGTDIVAKIVPVFNAANNILDTQLLALNCWKENGNWQYRWNNLAAIDDPVLKLELYRRNELIDYAEYKNIKWTVLGCNNIIKSGMGVETSVLNSDSSAVAAVYYDQAKYDASNSNYYFNYIIKAQASLMQDITEKKENGEPNQQIRQDYYCCFGVPIIIKRKNSTPYSVGLDKNLTMRQVLYNNEGRSPQYNKNQGIKLIFDSDEPLKYKRTIECETRGGLTSGQRPSALQIINLQANEDETYDVDYLPADKVNEDLQKIKQKKNACTQEWRNITAQYEQNYKVAAEDEIGELTKNYLNNTNYNPNVNWDDEDYNPLTGEPSYANMGYEQYTKWMNIYNHFLENISAQEDIFIKIKPADIYTGEYSNNVVHIKIYKGEKENNDLEYELYVPIYMSLNTYGLTALNNWDGNSVEINEDQKYVLAPQIGAGEKNPSDNTFTGILMGKEVTYDESNQEENRVGLLGYYHGKQSIFLDATTGDAIFGLPEYDAADAGDPLKEGRIELHPGGVSSIAGWNIDSRSLYRVIPKEWEAAWENNTKFDRFRQYTKNNYGHNTDIFQELAAPYKAHPDFPKSANAPQGASGSIPHDQQGILLSGFPAYISVKGRPLTAADISSSSNKAVKIGESFELELDPNGRSLFTIFLHKKKNPNNENGDPGWYRVPRVGIDRQGRFYTNALKDETSNLLMGFVGAFGISADQAQEEDEDSSILRPNKKGYSGLSFDFEDNDTLFKIFTPIKNLDGNNDGRKSPLYISSSSDIPNDTITSKDEGLRPIGIYGGKYINLYAGDNDNQINPIKTTAIKLNHNPGNATNDEPSNYSIQLITQTDSTTASSNKAELFLSQNKTGQLYHNQAWNTTINGDYTGNFGSKATSKATVTYNGINTNYFKGNNSNYFSSINYLNHGFYADINKNVGSAGTINIKYGAYDTSLSHYKQILLANNNTLTYTQKTSENQYAITNIFKLDSDKTSKIGILLQNQKNDGPAKVVIGNNSLYLNNENGTSYAIHDSQYTEANMQIKSIGTSNGLSLYAENGNSSGLKAYVGMKFIPNGTNAGFYLNASGEKLSQDSGEGVDSKGFYLMSKYKLIDNENEYKEDSNGLYYKHKTKNEYTLISTYNNLSPTDKQNWDTNKRYKATWNHYIPFFGAQIGPKLHTKALYVDGLLNPAATDGEDINPIKDIGIYSTYGIKTSNTFKSAKMTDTSYPGNNSANLGTDDIVKWAKEHTHPFSKGVTINLLQSSTSQSYATVIQGDVDSNATINVYGGVTSTSSAEFDGGRIYVKIKLPKNLEEEKTISGYFNVDSDGHVTIGPGTEVRNHVTVSSVEGFTVSSSSSCSLTTFSDSTNAIEGTTGSSDPIQ